MKPRLGAGGCGSGAGMLAMAAIVPVLLPLPAVARCGEITHRLSNRVRRDLQRS